MKKLKRKKIFLENLTGLQLHLVAFLLLICISFYAFYDFLIFNNLYLYADIGSDTMTAFWPNFVATSDYIRAYGFPSWSFRQGMGQNMLAFSVGDPFNWILYLAGSKYIPFAIAYVEVLKIGMAGSFFLAFLRQLKLSHYVCLIGGLCYAFSGFMIVGSGWYIFSSEAVLFAFLLFSFEKHFQNSNKWLFPIAVCLLGSYNPFNWITYGIILWFYASLRFFTTGENSVKGYVKFITVILVSAILGVGISAFVSTSSMVEMLGSPRVGGDAGLISSLEQNSLFYIDKLNYYVTVVFRIFSSDLQGTGSSFRGWTNYLEAPNFYSGLFSLLLASQYLLLKTKENKKPYLLFALIVFLPAIIPVFRYAIWLFSGDYFRGYSLWVAFTLILFSVKALEGILNGAKQNNYLLFFVLGLSVAVLLYPFSHFEESGTLRFYIIAGLILYSTSILLLQSKQISYYLQIFILILVIVEFASSSKITTSKRISLQASELYKKIGYNDYSIEAIKYLKEKDPEFYRIEKAYPSGVANMPTLNDAKIQEYYGTSSYNSFNQGSYINFLDKMEVINGEVENQTRWSVGLKNRPVLQTWASTKYLLVKSGTIKNITGYSKIHVIENIEIWKNDHFLPLGFTGQSVATESEFLSLNLQQKDIGIMQTVAVEDEKIDIFKQLDLWELNNIPINYSLELLAKDVDKLSENTLQITVFKEKQINGNIALGQPKILVLSVPYDQGWHAEVNGEDAIIHKINFGFSGILLNPGKNHIELSYKPRYFYSSIFISIISLLILISSNLKPKPQA